MLTITVFVESGPAFIYNGADIQEVPIGERDHE
jgi:hypothetical protein